jgi:hypothetical protein
MIHLSHGTVENILDYLDENPTSMLATSASSVEASEARCRIRSAGFRENIRPCRPSLWLDKVGISHSDLVNMDDEINEWISVGMTSKTDELRKAKEGAIYASSWNFCIIL